MGHWGRSVFHSRMCKIAWCNAKPWWCNLIKWICIWQWGTMEQVSTLQPSIHSKSNKNSTAVPLPPPNYMYAKKYINRKNWVASANCIACTLHGMAALPACHNNHTNNLSWVPVRDCTSPTHPSCCLSLLLPPSLKILHILAQDKSTQWAITYITVLSNLFKESLQILKWWWHLPFQSRSNNGE